MTPCPTCAKMIINAGIVRVVCEKIYHGGKEGEQMFADVGIPIEVLDKTLEVYANQ